MWVGVKKRNKCQDEVVNVRGRCKTNKCDTTMDATWATSNCCTSMVQPVLNSGCPEAAVPCTLYCTCIRYGSDAPTIRKKQSPNSSWWNHKQQQVNNAQTHKEWEGDSDRERSWWERKEEKEVWGRKWWMWSLPNKQMWHHNGCKDLGHVKLSYQHGTNAIVQSAGEWKLPNDAARTGIRYGRDALTVSMVVTVLYSRCTETLLPCSPYWTCIQYGSDAPTVRKQASTKFIMVKS